MEHLIRVSSSFSRKEVIIVRKREYTCILLLTLTIILILLLFIIVEIKKWYSNWVSYQLIKGWHSIKLSVPLNIY